MSRCILKCYMRVMEEYNCHRCGSRVSGRFCGDCGSRVVPEGKRDLIKEFLFTFMDLEKRFVHTLKLMLISPRTVIFEYIKDGERAKFFPPIRLLMITLVVSYFWFTLTQNLFVDEAGLYESMKESFLRRSRTGEKDLVFSEENYKIFYEEFNRIMNFFYKALNALGILVATPVSMLFYKKLKFNFVDHLVLNTFVMSAQSFVVMFFGLLILLLPINYFTFGYMGYLPMLIYSFYFYRDLGKGSYDRPFLRALAVSVLLVLLYTLANSIFGLVTFFYIGTYTPSVFVPGVPVQ